MYEFLKKIFSFVASYPDIVTCITTNVVTLICVLYTVRSSKKETTRMIHADVMPFLYSLKDTNNHERTITFETSNPNAADVTSIKSYIRNSNNGIAIVKKIIINKEEYVPKTDCIIDKGCTVCININIPQGKLESLDGEIEICDIYKNKYTYPIEIRGLNFYIKSSDNTNQSPPHKNYVKNIQTSNVTNSIIVAGDNNKINNNAVHTNDKPSNKKN